MFMLISLVNKTQIFKKRNIYSTKIIWEKETGEFSTGEFSAREFDEGELSAGEFSGHHNHDNNKM